MNIFFKQLVTVTMIFFVFTGASECRAEVEKAILTLEAAVQEGIKNNTLISEAIENERAAVENEKSARASLFPSLTASYGYTRMKDAPYVILGPYPQVDIGKKNSISWDVTVTQPLFTGFSLTTRRKIAALGVDIQGIEKEQAVLDVAKQVKIAYFQILLVRRATEVAEEEVKQLEGHANDAEQFYAQGIVPYNDLLKSQVALARARQDKVSVDSDLIVSISGTETLKRDPETG
ncbi:MAG: TolC family protein [Deltaproteobacteria bacterium]|nr:TolC family protein [Deltaproteobacteria bacterium]